MLLESPNELKCGYESNCRSPPGLARGEGGKTSYAVGSAAGVLLSVSCHAPDTDMPEEGYTRLAKHKIDCMAGETLTSEEVSVKTTGKKTILRCTSNDG